MKRLVFFLGLALFCRAFASPISKPDHIIIVIEENHGYSEIIGNLRQAPFINALARKGALFAQSYAVTHPSQPNYLAIFSGSTQGNRDDQCPAPGSPFKTPNLAEELKAKGYTFAAYSEDLPYTGYTGCRSKQYARKHDPWANWTEAAKLNDPFSSFPSDYSRLPDVAFVIPNQINDMHSAPIAVGDRWLEKNLSGYIEWAKTHHSLFILTFDEDDNTPRNRIPTLFIGPMVKHGKFAERITHYDLLRTLETIYGLKPAGHARAHPITSVWRFH